MFVSYRETSFELRIQAKESNFNPIKSGRPSAYVRFTSSLSRNAFKD